jgi:tetratricopeptide (TPR) repeat protein
MVKRQRSKQTAIAAIVLTLSWFCYCAFGSLSLRNYENDPNMAKAMEYDLGENQHDYDKADRAKAEKYYLEYLKNVQESFQKARVYVRLGALYATGFDVKKGEKADYNKARFYFRKALELEPERIDRSTIKARTMLASMKEAGRARIKARLDVYEWLSSIDEEIIRKEWLPLTPDNNSPTPLQMKKLDVRYNLLSNLETNMLSEIKHLPDVEAEGLLHEIEQRFSGTEMEKLASKHAAEKSIPSPEIPKTKAPVEVEKPREEIVPEKPHEEKVPEEAAYPAWVYGVPAGIIGIGAMTAVLVLLLKKKATNSSK